MELSEQDFKHLLSNPYYAIVFDPEVFKVEQSIVKEDWVEENAKTIQETSSKVWLEKLLNNLSKFDRSNREADPYRTVSISQDLNNDHEVLIPKATWIAANEKLISEIGSEEWLWRLLESLETGGV